MKITTIIVEGRYDAELLKALLPSTMDGTFKLRIAGGRSAAVGVARTVLTMHKSPVALVLDADSNTATEIRQKNETLNQLLSRATLGAPYKVFLAVPTIECVFFASEQVVEEVTRTKPLEIDMRTAEVNPKMVLDILLTKSGRRRELAYNLIGVSPAAISQMQEHQLIHDLIAFIESEGVKS